MQLRIKTGDGTVVPVSKLLTIKTDSDNLAVSGTDNIITLQDTKESYDEWYSTFINRKAIAIHGGGTVGDTQFEEGVRVYTHYEDKPYIRSITGSTPDSTGNVQLLPGNTLDIVPLDSRISFEQIDIPVDGGLGAVLEDINRCAWYLYHTYNSFVYRMNIWDPNTTSAPMFPTARMLGTIQAYQAVVAAWNMRVWRRSFLWDLSPIRETVSFSVGYMALDCVNPDVVCVVTIDNVDPANDDTTSFFTIYDQGISTNINLSAVRTTITKTTANGDVRVSGAGTDDAAASKTNWSRITIEITLGTLKQGEYYKAAFSLAVAQNETTTLYYQQVADKFNIIDIKTTWVVDSINEYTIENEGEKMRALLTYEEPENEDEEYIE